MASGHGLGVMPTSAVKCQGCGGPCCPISINDKDLCTACFKKSDGKGSVESSKKSPSKGLDLKNPATQSAGVLASPGTRGSLSNLSVTSSLSVTSPADQSRPGSGASMIVNPAESTMSEITDRSIDSSSAETPLSGPASTAEDLPVDKSTTPDDSSASGSSAAQQKSTS